MGFSHSNNGLNSPQATDAVARLSELGVVRRANVP